MLNLLNYNLLLTLTLFDAGERTQTDDYYTQAQVSFTRFERLPQTVAIPERTRLEIITHLAATAVRLGNLEQFCTYVTQGAEGINALGSPKRRQELIEVYTQGWKLWPREPQVKDLADLLVQ